MGSNNSVPSSFLGSGNQLWDQHHGPLVQVQRAHQDLLTSLHLEGLGHKVKHQVGKLNASLHSFNQGSGFWTLAK